MANPYPWTTEKTFKNKIRILHRARTVSSAAAVVLSLVFSPLALIAMAWGQFSYRRMNDSFKWRGKFLFVLGAVLMFVWTLLKWNPFIGFYNLMKQFGAEADVSMSESIRVYLLNGLPIALMFVGIAVLFMNWYLEYTGRRYLYASAPNMFQKRKVKKAREKFMNDDLDPNVFEIGVVKTDVLPWRENRRGMVVGTDFRNLKHGYLIGANGTGKTIAAMNIAAEYVDAGWCIIFPDFKGDRKTENMLAAIAREKNVPFYSFWSSSTDTGFNYDPLKGVTDISPASIIITAFDFPTDGPAKHYTDQAEKYLALQFSVLGQFTEMNENESTFDWLLRTMNPDTLLTMLKPAMGGRDKDRAAEAKRLAMEIGGIKRNDLSGLEANLSKMVNTMGAKMRPQEHMINFRKAAEEKAIVYFGLPSSGDKIVMRALGALIIRDMVSFTSERQNIVGEDVGNPVLVMPDEASQLQEKAEAMLEILQQGRSAKVMMFPAMQTFGAFTEKFIRELLGNSPTSVVLRVSDEVTAARISDTLGTMVVRSERRDTQSAMDALGAEQQVATGTGAGTLMEGPRIPANTIKELSNQTALVFFPESSTQATVKKPRRGRVRGDEVRSDIPTTYLFSRQYILDAENDTEVTRLMLRHTLGLEDEYVDASVPLEEYPDIPWADDTGAKVPANDSPFDGDVPDTGEHPGKLASSYEDAVSDEALFDEPQDEAPVLGEEPVEEYWEPEDGPDHSDAFNDDIGITPVEVVQPFSNENVGVESGDGEPVGVEDSEDEWGAPEETTIDHVETDDPSMRGYQGALPESSNSRAKSAPVKKENKVDDSSEENDDGLW